MALTLADGVYYVRSEIGEPQQYNWADYQIIKDLNYSAKKMCSIGSTLTGFSNLSMSQTGSSTIGLQEAFLPQNIDQIKAVKFFFGQLFDLEYKDWKELQEGAIVGSIPRWYYIKTSTKSMTPQVTATSDIQQISLDPTVPQGSGYAQVIGVWPIPPNPSQIHVWYSYFHPLMADPDDICEIPERFMEGWAAYAIARCKRIENAHTEAQAYTMQFEKTCEDYRIYASTHRTADKPARYGMNLQPWRQSASSSVVVVDPFPTDVGI
jgi:hypothetical protein